MKKLTREEIQALSDDDLNFRLIGEISHRRCSLIARPEDIHDYCNYLDAQFELAKKFGIYLALNNVPEKDLYVFVTKDQCAEGPTKRTGAELLLEAIQELEVVK